MDSYHGFALEVSSDIAVFKFTQPGRFNALDQRMKRELAEAVFRLNIEGAARAIVFHAEGRAFSSGDDISGVAREENGHAHLTMETPKGKGSTAKTNRVAFLVAQPLVRAIVNSDIPTIAAIDGYAVQSGLSLALACDFRIASRNAKLSSGTLRFAMLDDADGYYLLTRYLGLARATQFVLLAEFADAPAAAKLGLVNEVVDEESSYQRALELANTLAEAPARSLRLAKRALRFAVDGNLDQCFDYIANAAALSDYDDDFTEGLSAFREKRAARFRPVLSSEVKS